MAAQRERQVMIALRLNVDEREMVQELVDADGVSVSDAVRMAVRREHERRFGEKKPKVARR